MFGKPFEIDKTMYTQAIRNIVGINRLPRDTKSPLFGIEIEAEDFTRAPKTPLNEGWRVDHDGSLRNNGVEFITNQPITLEKGKELLKNFEQYNKDMRLDFSERTSIHVHFNAADWTIEDLHKFTVLYYLIENPFTLAAGGEERVGNRFCLRAIDANEVVSRLKNFLRTQDFMMFDVGGERRYLALNYSSFPKFGSLEFRAHKGTANATDLSLYLEATAELREVKDKFKSATEIIETYSMYGTLRFLKSFLPKTLEFMNSYLTEREIEEQIGRSYYIAQDIAYCVNIVDKKETKPVRDPWQQAAIKPRMARGFRTGARFTQVFNEIDGTLEIRPR